MGKDLTGARSPHRQLVPDEVGPEQHEQTFLRAIAIKADPPCAQASATEDLGAGKPHAGDCAGGAGQPAFLPQEAPGTILTNTRRSECGACQGL